MKNKNGGKVVPLEKSLSMRFRSHLRDMFPGALIYKIPDTAGIGGLRPFDAFAVISGHTFCFEFKRGNTKSATTYQQFHLDLASANGATSMIVNEVNLAAKLKAIEALVKGQGEKP